VPFVLEYRRRYNEMKVEIVTEGRLIDIIKDGFDAGVRLAEAIPRDMIAMPLGPHTRHDPFAPHTRAASVGLD
jgi:DNA-binding transcriptional LysR family regulator